MKNILLTCLLLLGTTVAMAQKTLPNVKIQDGKGKMIQTESLLDGKTPMIVSFWATWCKPCIQELNAISDAMPDWLDEVNFKLIAVSVDDSKGASKAVALANGKGWDATVLLDKNQDLKRAMNVTATPQVFVVDGKGNIVYSHTGYTPGSENELFKQLKKLKKK